MTHQDGLLVSVRLGRLERRRLPLSAPGIPGLRRCAAFIDWIFEEAAGQDGAAGKVGALYGTVGVDFAKVMSTFRAVATASQRADT